jgi:hypothetical protein
LCGGFVDYLGPEFLREVVAHAWVGDESAPGMRAAVSRPPFGLMIGSSAPEMTSVGTVI